MGSQGYILNNQEPQDDSQLPVDDYAWVSVDKGYYIFVTNGLIRIKEIFRTLQIVLHTSIPLTRQWPLFHVYVRHLPC